MAAVAVPPSALPSLSGFRPRLAPAVPPVRRHRSPAPAGRPTAAVYRRRRATALVVLGALVALVWWGSAALLVARTAPLEATVTAGAAPAAAAPAPAAAPPAAHVYVVRPGDTLWTIARRLQPEGDVRPLVDRLAERNGGTGLQAGQRLDLDGLR